MTYGNWTAGARNAPENVPYDVIYDKMLLERLTQNNIYDRFGTAKFIPANAGVKKAFAFRYKNLQPATTPLTEGIPPAAVNIEREKVEWDVAQYGNVVKYTDQIDIFDVRKVKADFTDILGDNASDTLDEIYKNVIFNGTQVIYAGNQTSRADVASTNSVVTKEDLIYATLKLRNAKIRKKTSIVTATTRVDTHPIRPSYIGFVCPNVTEQLRKIDGFIDVANYSSSEKAMKNEVGSFNDIRFIESNNDAVWNVGGKNVYGIVIFGDGFYATTTVRGKGGVQAIHKPLGSSGTADPLNQQGSIGWKAFAGGVILNNTAGIRIETTVELEG